MSVAVMSPAAATNRSASGHNHFPASGHHHHHPFRNRTQELHSIFDLLRKSSTASISNSNAIAAAAQQDGPVAKKRTIQQQSEELRRFNDSAARFSNELSSLAETVGNLTRLTQGAGASSGADAFEENSQEISRLTQVVRTRLGQLHDDLNDLADLKEASDASLSSASGNNAMTKHNGAVVAGLRSKLVGTGNNFRQVLQRRTQTMKDATNRRSKLLADRGAAGADFNATSKSALMAAASAHQQHDDNNGGANAGVSGMTSSQALMTQNRNLNYLRDRQQAVHEIEVAVREVGEIVQDFTRLVYEQDETIVRIDMDVEDALENVNAGSGELMKYLASLSSQRGFILKVLGVLFVFLLFFGFFIVR